MKQPTANKNQMQRSPKQDAVTAEPDSGQALQLATLLDGLPPLSATADSHINDAKYIRILPPREYREPIARFVAGLKAIGHKANDPSSPNGQADQSPRPKFLIRCHPDGHLCLAPACLTELLRQEIRRELTQRGEAQRYYETEIYEQEATADAKNRLRISRVLTDRVSIQRKVVFCRKGWQIQIWAEERLETQDKNPVVSQDSKGSPSHRSAQRFSPVGTGCA